ncbi:sugar-transfer associated ATP-grasp domain-containing protein [Roseobacter ponti]|uniref:Alpha-L-glutamate ligase-related protein ATP-grasp domain-containing protein n=1 Tax=Roseobacter ponti TaxID=1891787 RepID=A0A858SUT5_9RHOB|nr:sugar-transfer associated ATP-grasp domain-containing protein [Roseobacter ponti]QJF52474.1 hypothetical protein G3256_15495 [Roseobacter ponti]
MNTAVATDALLEKGDAKKDVKSPEIIRVARQYGASPLRQLREIFSLRSGRSRLTTRDYYDNGLYDPALSMTEKREFLGLAASEALNDRLSPEETKRYGAFVCNKLLHGALLRQLGFAATETLAVVAKTGEYGALPALQDADALFAFLSDRSVYPVFGKPVDGSLSVGSVMLSGLDSAGETLELASGDHRPLRAFCDEVLAKYGTGYLLQKALRPHPDLVPVTGDMTGSVRIVTAMNTSTPSVAYGLWKIPAPRAMSDNFWQGGSMIARVDMQTGEVLACRQGTGPDTIDVENHPETGAAIVGLKLPGFEDACDLARRAHALMPDLGVCGWDIGLTVDGPVIIECNNSPFHTLYQLAHRRGVMNPDLMPVWEATAARQKERLTFIRAARKKKKR